MSRKPIPKRFFCSCCGVFRSGRRHEVHKVKGESPDFPAPSTTPRFAVGYCSSCYAKVKKPYFIVTPQGVNVPAVSLRSKHFSSTRETVNGLHAMAEVPVDTELIYPGLMMDVSEMAHFEEHFGYAVNQDWSRNGPKDYGIPSALLGQYQPGGEDINPFSCAHKINARIPGVNTTVDYNCIFSQVRVTPAHIERHPDLGKQLKVGRMYPGVRVTKTIRPREEFVLHSYGAGFWKGDRLLKKKQKKRWGLRGLMLDHVNWLVEHRQRLQKVRARRLKPVKVQRHY